jgi:hypothetical protein
MWQVAPASFRRPQLNRYLDCRRAIGSKPNPWPRRVSDDGALDPRLRRERARSKLFSDDLRTDTGSRRRPAYDDGPIRIGRRPRAVVGTSNRHLDAVTLQWIRRRLWCSITTNTYNRQKVAVTATKTIAIYARVFGCPAELCHPTRGNGDATQGHNRRRPRDDESACESGSGQTWLARPRSPFSVLGNNDIGKSLTQWTRLCGPIGAA